MTRESGSERSCRLFVAHPLAANSEDGLGTINLPFRVSGMNC